jgi:RNA-binding protein PNO1
MEVDKAPTAAASSSGAMAVDAAGGVQKPLFGALMPSEMGGGRPQYRKVQVPPHRFAPLKKAWLEIYTPVYEHMKVDIRMNLKVGNSDRFATGSAIRTGFGSISVYSMPVATFPVIFG